MPTQDIINAAIGVAGALGGWWLKTIWEALRELQKADQMLAEKVSAIEVLVAGQYIRRDEFEKMATALFSKLDKIYDRLESKADKH
jgi:uncharacterized protein YcbK (DUF882 family)